MNHKQKYLKYKLKYFNLKNGYRQSGGVEEESKTQRILSIEEKEIIERINSTWKNDILKETVKTYIMKFGLPYDVCKDHVIWKNIAGFDKTVVVDEQIEHTHPMKHIDFVYSTKKIQGLKPEHVCIVVQATGSIMIDLLKQEATARCHYLIKNAVSLGFVQDVVAGKISKDEAREEYGRRILSNVYPSWFKDPLNNAHKTSFIIIRRRTHTDDLI